MSIFHSKDFNYDNLPNNEVYLSFKITQNSSVRVSLVNQAGISPPSDPVSVEYTRRITTCMIFLFDF